MIFDVIRLAFCYDKSKNKIKQKKEEKHFVFLTPHVTFTVMAVAVIVADVKYFFL